MVEFLSIVLAEGLRIDLYQASNVGLGNAEACQCLDLATLVRPGGLLLNAEGLAAGSPSSRLARVFDEVRRRGSPPADGWWEAIEADPAFAEAVAERARLKERMRGAGRKSSAAAHCRALRRAGFREAAVAWRYLDEALVVGWR